ncbi:MAG: DNA recombination protein RmuC [Candidatus Pacebacteria bacterium]|nr:DNA recombination protein RmuC [Candidatus Paceibacterota bacterium]
MILEIIIIILLLFVLGGILFFFKRTSEDKTLVLMEEKLKSLFDLNSSLRQELDTKLSEVHQTNRDQFGQSARLISNITEKLTKLDETNRQVVNFSSQLQNLQDILKNPKHRGVLGEYYLEETLKNVLPPNSYQMQYSFKDGTIVDAVVFVKDKIIPVDSKFSLENYEKLLNCKDKDLRVKLERQFKADLKARIDETAKYVKPGEKTLDFAFMFIPSEAIYYDLLVGKVGIVHRDLIEYAFKEKKVVIVSPTSFLAYLQTVLQGLRAMQIEESALEIKKNVEKLSRHIISYEGYLQKLGNTLGTSVNHYNSAYKEFKKIDKDVTKIAGKDSKVEALELDKPKLDD